MKLIPNTDLRVFELSLGGNTFGWTSDKDESFEVLDGYAEVGGNFLDTADMYSVWAEGNPGGVSEEIIGEWLASRGNRERMILATKFAQHPQRKGLSYENAHAALDDSLRRLKTDRIDLYYLHHDDDDVAVIDQVRTAHSLVETGKVRYIGLSNFTPERMREWFTTAHEHELTVPVAVQLEYSLVNRADYERDYAPIVKEFDVGSFSYFSLASGFLTGKYRTQEDIDVAARKGFASNYFSDDGLKVVDALTEIALSRRCELSTVALAWLRAKGITAPVASARVFSQLPGLLASTAMTLTDEEVAVLDNASAPFAQ